MLSKIKQLLPRVLRSQSSGRSIWQMVELGRSCVHPAYRDGTVIMALWGALLQFMVRNRLSYMIGCASIPLTQNSRRGGDIVSSIWAKVSSTHSVDCAFKAWAHTPFPVAQFNQSLDVEPPALIKGYLRLGARVLGTPAWEFVSRLCHITS